MRGRPAPRLVAKLGLIRLIARLEDGLVSLCNTCGRQKSQLIAHRGSPLVTRSCLRRAT